ncbi:hypothetical protein KC331_g175 [Hortaea werneckii]|nr:hypothetical protein KC331_g175 [Hortaea werneckii]KAI7722784.1 hypothetical protein KC353_g198 [Hortaea werneckii]
MLATLLSFGLDPEHFDSSLFIAWPRSCDPGWLAEDIAPDPMFIDFLRACLQRQPGFAGCDDLTEAVLTGEDSEFESALRRAKADGGFLRTLPNALGQTATHLAISSPARLEKILEAGADPDCVDRAGLTPLMYAAAYGQHHFLDYAMCRRNLHVIESLIKWLRETGHHGTAFEVLNYCIAYCITQYNDHYDITIPDRLFQLDADVYTTVNRSGFASPNIRDDAGKTPFMQVAHLVDSNTLIAFASEEQGAEFNAQDAKGKTALHYLLGLRPDTFAGARAEQIQAMANFNTKSSRNVCTDDDIISSLATLCLLYEQQSITKHGSIVARRKPKVNQLDAPVTPSQQVIRPVLQSNPCTSQLHVDYNKDEIKYRFSFKTTPRIREITIDCYKDWLRWCDRNFVKLDIKCGRRNYTEYGWHLVSMFEDKVDELRSDTETWYTAPEQPAETQ